MNFKALFFTIFFLIFSGLLFAQENPGCTDPQANNFDPGADYNDGSCTYNPTIYNPDLKYLLPDEVDETSGLIFWNELMWTINDSGGDPILYALDTADRDCKQENYYQ